MKYLVWRTGKGLCYTQGRQTVRCATKRQDSHEAERQRSGGPRVEAIEIYKRLKAVTELILVWGRRAGRGRYSRVQNTRISGYGRGVKLGRSGTDQAVSRHASRITHHRLRAGQGATKVYREGMLDAL